MATKNEIRTKELSCQPVLINGEEQGYRPNSLVWARGEGETRVTAIAGGKVVVGNDCSTKIAYVQMDFPDTLDLEIKVEEWKRKPGAITIQLVDSGESFEEMTLVTHPEFSSQTDSSVTLRFEGPPIARK